MLSQIITGLGNDGRRDFDLRFNLGPAVKCKGYREVKGLNCFKCWDRRDGRGVEENPEPEAGVIKEGRWAGEGQTGEAKVSGGRTFKNKTWFEVER